jgi:hypothetical protein
MNEQNQKEHTDHQPDAASVRRGPDIGLQARFGWFSAVLVLTSSKHTILIKQKSID